METNDILNRLKINLYVEILEAINEPNHERINGLLDTSRLIHRSGILTDSDYKTIWDVLRKANKSIIN